MKKMYRIALTVGALLIGLSTGFAIAATGNIGMIQRRSNEDLALPTRVLDRNGELITTFFSTENRTLVHFNELPRTLFQALITREDQSFFNHNGFSFRGTARAAANLLLNKYVSGGSTLSQQVAGVLYADRRQFSIARKLKELWWSYQIERSWSKQEILEEYVNKMYFGHGNYGVEASSRFFFGHSAQELNSAESVMLVIQLASPVRYSPFKNPAFARDRQQEILQQMVDLGFISQAQMDYDFQSYWDSFDFTREGFSSAFLTRDDKAPYFSEYIRSILLNDLQFSNEEINTQGLTIHTTLDLSVQQSARTYFDEGLERANAVYRMNASASKDRTQSAIPVAALGMLLFDSGDRFFSQGTLQVQEAKKQFLRTVQPALALADLLLQPSPNSLASQVAVKSQEQSTKLYQEETVEGALITIDNRDFSISAMIGGSSFDATNQFNRAVNAFVQPGSAFKPLYYAAALEHRVITPSTIIWDSPAVFYDEYNNAYTPLNYKGEWKGAVTARYALAQSMNVPSLKILDRVGFDRALPIAGALLDMPPDKFESAGLVPKYPVGLGIVSVSPLAMAKAYATIENQGRKVVPYAIISIQNKDGKTIYQGGASFSGEKIISEQTAYVLTSMLQTAAEGGTLAYANNVAGGFTQPTAGKTGTTQNWSDAWTLGFTPYYTTALWFGFDRGGQSLGTNQTGAITTGPVWGKYMEEINKNLPVRQFPRPNGIVTAVINPDNDTLARANSSSRRSEVYIVGTEPKVYDNPQAALQQQDEFIDRLQNASWDLSTPSAPSGGGSASAPRSGSPNLRLRVPSYSGSTRARQTAPPTTQQRTSQQQTAPAQYQQAPTPATTVPPPQPQYQSQPPASSRSGFQTSQPSGQPQSPQQQNQNSAAVSTPQAPLQQSQQSNLPQNPAQPYNPAMTQQPTTTPRPPGPPTNPSVNQPASQPTNQQFTQQVPPAVPPAGNNSVPTNSQQAADGASGASSSPAPSQVQQSVSTTNGAALTNPQNAAPSSYGPPTQNNQLNQPVQSSTFTPSQVPLN